MVIGYIHIIKVSKEEYLKIKAKGEEFIYSFESDGEECYGGDYIRLEEDRENGLQGEKCDYEVIRARYDKDSNMYTVRLRKNEGELTILWWTKICYDTKRS